MYELSPAPRVFALPPGVDFPKALVAGLQDRMAPAAPEAWAEVTLVLNTLRMQRRVRQAFAAGPAQVLPRIQLLTDVAEPAVMAGLPVPVPGLRRRLELVQLVARLLEVQPDLAPRTALYDLADSLAALMDEMQIEDVAPARLTELDVSDQSGHWKRAQDILGVLQGYFEAGFEAPDSVALQRLAVDATIAQWRADPPHHPVIIAGSTASRGTTRRLMEAVLDLPQGAIVLPGFDWDMPAPVWSGMTEALAHEDHPQFRFARLLNSLDIGPEQVQRWHGTAPPHAGRNKVWSLALRPAPVTGQWLQEGPGLPDLPQTMADVTLLEAESPRDEAQAIALRLRKAADEGITAALITPDGMLGRRVGAALERWGILPDDSAGRPAQLSPTGRFLRHCARLLTGELTSEALLTVLKHPLCHRGAERAQHNLNTRDLETEIRRKGWPFPKPEPLQGWAEARARAPWGAWITGVFFANLPTGPRPVRDWLHDHLALAETICAGSEAETSPLWEDENGREIKVIVEELRACADAGGDVGFNDYLTLFDAVLSRGKLRETRQTHPKILIWGTLEARAMGADLLILAGLNEGSWPEAPAADPWLNRLMRDEAGLLLPERKIGLSAHDFQIAACGPEVWLTRAVRSDEAETVPARWSDRLTNLMQGLPQRGGPEALAEMRARGQVWAHWARALDTPVAASPARRPAPCPPVAARPKELSVTEIRHLIRDPYAIYAKRILRLQPQMPLQRVPDYALRGTVAHDILETFVRDTRANPACLTAAYLMQVTDRVMAEKVPWPAMRQVWRTRMGRVADWFVTGEQARQSEGHPVLIEQKGAAHIAALGFALTGKPDRIDITQDGRAVIYDYKTGTPPSEREQKSFEKQLLLEAAMVERGAFADLHAASVAQASYIGLKPPGILRDAPLQEVSPGETWAQFEALIARFFMEETGFTSRNAKRTETDYGDYDHLARFGEWDTSQAPHKEVLE